MIYRNRVNVGTTINTLPYVIPAYIPYVTPGTTGNLLTSDGSNWITGIPSATKYQLQGLGVGTAASTITGEIRATNNVTAYYSDARLKKVISNIKKWHKNEKRKSVFNIKSFFICSTLLKLNFNCLCNRKYVLFFL